VTTAGGDGDGFDEDGFTVNGSQARRKFLVLNDAPVGVERDDDLLGTGATARRLADLLLDSREAAPFTLAIDAAWGSGKSSLLHAIDHHLQDTADVRTVWFNAWTAERADVLEGLIKSVLRSFDRNVIRRAVRRMASHERLISGLRAASLVAVSFVGLSRVVDELWQRLIADATSRNRIRDVLFGMAKSWLDQAKPDEHRMLVVFVDDLDRCSNEQIVQVCEAMKLYLDVPGIVFVLACDGDVVLRAVRERTDAESGYLDKIIQVTHRISPPSTRRAERLVRGYAVRSGTDELFTDDMRALLIERTGGNPRAIKRLINTFVLEYHLRPEWDEAGPQNLLKIILLQQFYPTFYRLFVDSLDTDPIGDFLAYREFRMATAIGTHAPGATARVTDLFTRKHLAPPDPSAPEEALARLERQLPAEFVRRADDVEFASLLAGLVVPVNTSMVRRVLRRRPLTTSPQLRDPDADHSTDLSGVSVLWLDDQATQDFGLAQDLVDRGARLAIVNDKAAAVAQFRLFRPTVFVSDIHRYGDDAAGFTDLEEFRAEGIYRGPAIFYTSHVNDERRHRAAQLDARITESVSQVLTWLRE
jgi:CheY-like chemotaxis protein